MELIEAVIHNDANAVRELLTSGADPNYCLDAARVTPLHHAAQHNAVEVVELLLTAGADIHARTHPDNQSPLDVAKLFGHREIQILLEKFTQQIP